MPEVPRPRTRPRNTPRDAETSDTTGKPDSGESPARPERTREDAKLAASIQSMYEGVGTLALGVGLPRSMMTGDMRLVALSSTLMEPRSVVVEGENGAPVVKVIDPRTGAEAITDAWMTAAERNPRIKAALRKFTEGGAIAELIALHVPLVLPFLPGLPGLAFLAPDNASNGAAVPDL